MRESRPIQPGWDVYTRDGEHIGRVGDVAGGYVTVETGLRDPRRRFIPASSIREVEPERGRVVVDAAGAELDRLGWDRPPGDAVDHDGTWEGSRGGRPRGAPDGA